MNEYCFYVKSQILYGGIKSCCMNEALTLYHHLIVDLSLHKPHHFQPNLPVTGGDINISSIQ